MSAIAAYARARAVAADRAQPIATVAHLHVAARPLVFVPLTLAGEANAPLAALIGTGPDAARLLVVPQPRDRTQRFAFAAELAEVVLSYLGEFPVPDADPDAEPKNVPFADDAPQILVPNRAGVGFVRLLGRSTRFRQTTGDYPVPPGVPLLGRWLTWAAERTEFPGSSTLVAVTEALGLHWATGQSALEDANLAALVGWIAPPAGTGGSAAARRAEDPLRCPPAGPTTDPSFDNTVLAPAIRAHSEAPAGSAAERSALATLERAVRGQLEPTWQLMWQAVDLLRTLPPGASVSKRWETDRREFSDHARYLAAGGFPQARRDGAVRAARRLAQIERTLVQYAADRAFDDPLVLADQRVTGDAFAGRVTAVERDRRMPNERGTLVKRPLVTVWTADAPLLSPGTVVVSPLRRGQNAEVVELRPVEGGTEVTLVLLTGMGRKTLPDVGTVPQVGDEISYTSVVPDYPRSPSLPSSDETPWTHGGPPVPYEPTPTDAREEWE